MKYLIIILSLFTTLHAQHNIDLYSNGTIGGATLTSGSNYSIGVESVYNYDISNGKTFIGFGGGTGLNYFMYDNLKALNWNTIGKDVYFEIPLIANVTLGNDIARFYINGSYGVFARSKHKDDIGNIINYKTKIKNRSFESGFKFVVKKRILLMVGYEFNSIKINTRINKSQSIKIGIGVNFTK